MAKMEEDEENLNQDEASATPSPQQTRTLLHYFSKKPVPTSSDELNIDKSVEVDQDNKDANEKDVLKENKRPNKLSRKRRRDKNVDHEVKETLNDMIDKVIQEANETDPVEAVTPPAPENGDKKSVPGIGNYFRRLSKEEYRKEMSDSLSKSVMTVQAQIHTSSNQSEVIKTDEKAKLKAKKSRKRRCSNVSRTSDEADQIEVIGIEEIFEETVDKPTENIVVGSDAPKEEETTKISNDLFRKRAKKSLKEDENQELGQQQQHQVYDDESVDFDFLRVQTTGNKEENITSDLGKML